MSEKRKLRHCTPLQPLLPHLLFTPVQGEAGVARTNKLLEEAVTLCLGVDKDDDLAPLDPQAEELKEAPELVLLRDNLSKLLYSVTRDASTADHNFHGVLETAARKSLNRLGERRREQANLAVWAHGLED